MRSTLLWQSLLFLKLAFLSFRLLNIPLVVWSPSMFSLRLYSPAIIFFRKQLESSTYDLSKKFSKTILTALSVLGEKDIVLSQSSLG